MKNKINELQLNNLEKQCKDYQIPNNLIEKLCNVETIKNITILQYNCILYLIKVQKGGLLND